MFCLVDPAPLGGLVLLVLPLGGLVLVDRPLGGSGVPLGGREMPPVGQ